MVKSIRWRIQIWHGLILLLVLVSFGSLLVARLYRAKAREVDTELAGAAQLFVSILKSMPAHLLDNSLPGPPARSSAGADEADADLPPFDRPPRGDRPRPPRPEEFAEDVRPEDLLGPPRPRNGRPPRPPFDGPPGHHDPAEMSRRHEQRVLTVLELPDALAQRFVGPNEISPYFIIWRGDGTIYKSSPQPPDLAKPDLEFFPSAETLVYRTREEPQGELREVFLDGPADTVVVVGRSTRREMNELNGTLMIMVLSGGALLALGVGGGFWLSHRALDPIRTISRTAAAISSSNLKQRIDTTSIDVELAQLADTLNAAFARLESDFIRQARFTADASHELRTPLTIISGHLELALAHSKQGGDATEAIAACQRAAKRMKSLVDGLLLLARADAGRLDPEFRWFDLSATVEECVDLLQPLARDKAIHVTTAIDQADLVGDPRLLGQVVINLMTNAIQYTPQGGQVSVSLHTQNGNAKLAVADTGVGLAEKHREHLFERFYRADEARSRDSGGLGLGLAIARSLVTAHGGEITFTSQVGLGTEFVVRLPRHLHETPAPLA